MDRPVRREGFLNPDMQTLEVQRRLQEIAAATILTPIAGSTRSAYIKALAAAWDAGP